MRNKRDFKKTVKDIGTAACEEMMFGYYNIQGIDHSKVEDAVGNLLAGITEACADANNTFGKLMRDFDDESAYRRAKQAFFREHFTEVYDRFVKCLTDSVRLYNEAVPEAVKEANKKALAE